MVAIVLFLLVTALPVLAMRWVDPYTSAFMLHARYDAWRAKEQDYRTRYTWVDMANISPNAALAVIAAEDQQFRFHAGFDFDAISKAMERNASGKKVRGASTITQQVAKNMFLWPGRTWMRKGLEAWYTVLIETMWSKRRILEVYLNTAELGRGIYGVEAASQKYFRKPAAKLSRREAAALAAVLPAPRRFKVNSPSRYVAARRDWIARQMVSLGGRKYLDALDADETMPQRR